MPASDKNRRTAADALTDALLCAGVEYIFINSGTDYPPIIESWAKYEALDLRKPEIIIAPHETAAFHAAMGYAQATGKAQAVFVHVDVGTQNIGGAIHNAFRCRVPVFTLAGLSPHTLEGELPGGRNAYIQYVQNIADQAGIVRGYTKLASEYKVAENVAQLTCRAVQIANSEPRGPVYMTATREVLEQNECPVETDAGLWQPVAPSGLDGDSVERICRALAEAEQPLIVTSYLGRNEGAVAELVRLAQALAIPVVEVNRANMNFPGSHPLHLGFDAHELAQSADVILVIDCDVPWIPAKTRVTARVFYIDTDPLKENIPVWYIPSELFARADSCCALRQINAYLTERAMPDEKKISLRRAEIHARHSAQRGEWRDAEAAGNEITPEYLTACVREVVTDDTIILNETISHHAIVDRLLPRDKPGTHFTSGGSSLGWFGGAAIGVKLARPDAEVVALCGDGTFVFSCPTAVYWMAARYGTPFLTVIYNNAGWGAPKQITTNEHPDGYAAANGTFWTSFEPAARLDLIAKAAGGAFAHTVSNPDILKDVLREGLDAVRRGVPAVINVLLPPV